MITKKFEFIPGSLSPSCEWGGCEYLLCVAWDEDSTPDYFMGIWEDGRWWIREDSYDTGDDFYGEDDVECKHVLRPFTFRSMPDYYTLIGWCPLFGTGF